MIPQHLKNISEAIIISFTLSDFKVVSSFIEIGFWLSALLKMLTDDLIGLFIIKYATTV